MEDDNISGKMVLHSAGSSAELPTIPIPVLQALYKSLTNATDKLTEQRRLPAIFGVDDIEQLTIQLQQWIQPYNPISQNIRLTINTYSNDKKDSRKRLDFSDINQFKMQIQGRTERVSSAILVFDFIYKDNSTDTIRQCNATVELSGATRRVFFGKDFENSLGGYLGLRHDGHTMKLRISYSDSIVGRNLSGVFLDWYENLPRKEFKTMSKARYILHRSDSFEKYDQINVGFRFLPLLLGLVFAQFIGRKAQHYFVGFEPLIYWLILILVFSYIFSSIFGFALKKFEDSEKSYIVPLSLITTGDKRRQQEFLEKEASAETKLNFWTNTVFGGVVASILVALVLLYVDSGI